MLLIKLILYAIIEIGDIMKKKIIYGIVILAVIGILVANYFYNESQKDYYLECNYVTKFSNYNETLTFRYLEGTLFRYQRDEVITPKDMKTEYKKYEDIKNEAPNYAYFDYNIRNDGKKIYVTTKIEAFHMIDFYNDYTKELDITFDDTIDEVKKELESKDYICKIIRK